MSTTASEIMTTPVISVQEDQTIEDVIKLLANNEFSGVPVVNTDNVLVGILSDTDIICYSQKVSVIPFTDLSGWVSPHTDINDLASLRKGIELVATTKVKQVMTKKVYTVKENTDISEMAGLMCRRNINRIPVVDSEKKLVGMVSRADLIRSMAGL